MMIAHGYLLWFERGAPTEVGNNPFFSATGLNPETKPKTGLQGFKDLYKPTNGFRIKIYDLLKTKLLLMDSGVKVILGSVNVNSVM
jgi:hypothetical protein